MIRCLQQLDKNWDWHPFCSVRPNTNSWLKYWTYLNIWSNIENTRTCSFLAKNEHWTPKHCLKHHYLCLNRVEEQFWPIFDPILSYLGYTCFTAWFCEYLLSSELCGLLTQEIRFFHSKQIASVFCKNFAKDTFLRRNSCQNILNPSGLWICSLQNL